MIKVDAKNRSMRLRKKLYVNEFKVLGFEVDLTFSDTSTEEAMDVFFDDFLANIVEGNGLVFGGGGTREGFSGFVVPGARYVSATEEQRKLLGDWIEKHELITSHTIGKLVDANFDL